MARHILGVQASMWTHIAVTERAIDYQIYPRLLALAEVAWTPQRQRDWNDFIFPRSLPTTLVCGRSASNSAMPPRPARRWAHGTPPT